MIKLLFFAGLAEKTGQSEIEVEQADGWTIGQLTDWLKSEYPQAKGEIGQSMVAINEEYAEKTDIINDRDTVAYIPPVSGG